jgi:hypothetical protein
MGDTPYVHCSWYRCLLLATQLSAGSPIISGKLPKIDNEFRPRLAGHKPGTEDNLRKSVRDRSEFFENYR